ncbi:MAG: response regulator [Firmicutes bacterium]|nr:response regulator [Bacillota bacterium]
MFKVIVVDDEFNIREGIKKFIETNLTGFEVTHTASDGRGAIDILKKEHVDVVITDIKMSSLSGLDVARYIKQNGLSSKIVLISGYKDFEYAQKAIEYNVEHYLLKPTDFKQMKSVLCAVREQLENERHSFDEKERNRKLLSFFRSEFFIGLAMNAFKSKEEIRNRMQFLDLNVDPEQANCAVIDIKIEDYDEFLAAWGRGKEGLNNAIWNIINCADSRWLFYPILILDNTIKTICLFADKEQINFYKELCTILEEIKSNLFDYFSMQVNYTVLKTFKGIYELAGAVAYPKDGDANGEKLKLLRAYMLSGDGEKALNLFSAFFEQMRQSDADNLKANLLKWFELLLKGVFAAPEPAEVGIGLRKISDSEGYSEMRKQAEELISDICMMAGEKDNQVESVIRQAKNFIDENYMRDISLDDVANTVYLSPIYFSRFFKTHTGETFTDYLIGVRMKHAIELLSNTDYTINEISVRVGYNSRYFNRIFKKYTGFTPREYCRKVLFWGADKL